MVIGSSTVPSLFSSQSCSEYVCLLVLSLVDRISYRPLFFGGSLSLMWSSILVARSLQSDANLRLQISANINLQSGDSVYCLRLRPWCAVAGFFFVARHFRSTPPVTFFPSSYACCCGNFRCVHDSSTTSLSQTFLSLRGTCRLWRGMFRDPKVDKAVLVALLCVCFIDPEGEIFDGLCIILSCQKGTQWVVVVVERENEERRDEHRRYFLEEETDSSFLVDQLQRPLLPQHVSVSHHEVSEISQCKLPSFWRSSTDLWFLQIE